jgi:hypothetical protein
MYEIEKVNQYESIVTNLAVALEDSSLSDTLAGDAMSMESDETSVIALRDAWATLTDVIHSVEEELPFKLDQNSVTAAKAAAILSLDPKAVLGQGVSASVSLESQHHVVQANQSGLESRLSGAPSEFSLENYDGRQLHNMRAKAVLFNLMAPNPSDFVKTWFPFVILKPSESGYSITMDLLYVADDVTRNINASPTTFGRKSLTYAAIDSSILGEDNTRVVPHVTVDTAPLFVQPTDVPNWTEKVEAEDVVTNYLKFDTRFDMVQIGQTDFLLAQGEMDMTFQLDLRNNLRAILVDIDGNKMHFDTTNIVSSTFTKHNPESPTTMRLSFNSTSLIIDANSTQQDGSALVGALAAVVTDDLIIQLDVDIHGSLDVDTGRTTVHSGHMSVHKAFKVATNTELALVDPAIAPIDAAIAALTPAEWLGWLFLGYRSNLNHNQRGKLIGSTSYTEEYYVPLRTPFTIVSITSSTNDNKMVADLVSAVHIDMNNEAVDTLLETANTLRAFTINARVDLDRPDFLGIGRLHLRPRFIERYIDLPSQINSITSHQRASDIRAVLVNQIRDVALRLYTDSNWQSANNVINGTGQYAGAIPNGVGAVDDGSIDNRPTIIIGVSSYEAGYLFESGESRLLTDIFKYKIVTNDNLKMRGEIFLGLSDGNDNGTINPLGTGNTLYAPELLFNLQISRRNQTSKEISIFKHYRMISNTPVMGVIHVRNIDQALGMICEPCMAPQPTGLPVITAPLDQQAGGSAGW